MVRTALCVLKNLSPQGKVSWQGTDGFQWRTPAVFTLAPCWRAALLSLYSDHWSEPKTQDQRASTSKLNNNGRRTRWAGRNQGWNSGVLGYTNPGLPPHSSGFCRNSPYGRCHRDCLSWTCSGSRPWTASGLHTPGWRIELPSWAERHPYGACPLVRVMEQTCGRTTHRERVVERC